MSLSLLAFAIILLATGGTAGVNPGFRLALTNKAFDYIIQTGIPILEQKSFPIKTEFTGSQKIKVLGHIDYKLYNLNFYNLKIPTGTVKPSTTGITIQLTGMSLEGHASWQYRQDSWPHIHGSGTIDISIKGMSMFINAVLIGNNNQGNFSLVVFNCTATTGSIHINDHGKGSHLYNKAFNKFAKNIKGNLCNNIATTAIDNGINNLLKTFPMTVKVGPIAEVDYSFVQSPTYGYGYLETYHKGEFFFVKKPVEAPFDPSPLPPLTAASENMLYIWLTDYFFNTAAFVYQESGLLAKTITPDMVPKGFPLQLNTSELRFVLPKLYHAYPNMPMQLDLVSTKPPTLQVTPDGVNLTITGTMEADVIKPDKSIVNAFVIGVILHAVGDIGIHENGTNQVISGNITLYKFDLSLLSSNIGYFSVQLLQDTVNIVIKDFILRVVNYYTNIGIVLPMIKGIKFIDPQLKLGQGYVMVSTDIDYQPK